MADRPSVQWAQGLWVETGSSWVTGSSVPQFLHLVDFFAQKKASSLSSLTTPCAQQDHDPPWNQNALHAVSPLPHWLCAFFTVASPGSPMRDTAPCSPTSHCTLPGTHHVHCLASQSGHSSCHLDPLHRK